MDITTYKRPEQFTHCSQTLAIGLQINPQKK